MARIDYKLNYSRSIEGIPFIIRFKTVSIDITIAGINIVLKVFHL